MKDHGMPRTVRCRELAVAGAALTMMLGLVGCSAEPEGPQLFEPGELGFLVVDGVRIDDGVDYAVLCLWATSENGPLSIVAGNGDADGVSVKDVIISFNDARELTSASVLRGEDRVTWNRADGTPGPDFVTKGVAFSLVGALTDGTSTIDLEVEGTCATPFD